MKSSVRYYYRLTEERENKWMTVRRFKELISALNLSERDYNCDPFIVRKSRGRRRYEAILVEPTSTGGIVICCDDERNEHCGLETMGDFRTLFTGKVVYDDKEHELELDAPVAVVIEREWYSIVDEEFKVMLYDDYMATSCVMGKVRRVDLTDEDCEAIGIRSQLQEYVVKDASGRRVREMHESIMRDMVTGQSYCF